MLCTFLTTKCSVAGKTIRVLCTVCTVDNTKNRIFESRAAQIREQVFCYTRKSSKEMLACDWIRKFARQFKWLGVTKDDEAKSYAAKTGRLRLTRRIGG